MSNIIQTHADELSQQKFTDKISYTYHVSRIIDKILDADEKDELYGSNLASKEIARFIEFILEKLYDNEFLEDLDKCIRRIDEWVKPQFAGIPYGEPELETRYEMIPGLAFAAGLNLLDRKEMMMKHVRRGLYSGVPFGKQGILFKKPEELKENGE